MSRSESCKVYVGNLPPEVKKRDLEDIFYKYGKIIFVNLKNRHGPPFAFIEFEDPRDAEDAVEERDGYKLDGYKLRVEFPRGDGDRWRSVRRFEGRARIRSRRSVYRVLVSGLPPSGSWQDLKDHMRIAGEVGYANVHKDGSGVVEFLRFDDMDYAVKKLDDSRFRSHEGETARIRVKEDHRGGDRATRSGSPSYSPVRRSSRASKSASRSRSPSRSYSPYHRR